MLLTRSDKGRLWLVDRFSREWRAIDKAVLRKEIRNLYRSRLIKREKNTDGSCTYVLTDKGKKKILTYDIENMKIKQDKWDGKWRIVLFDIPEKLRKSRDILRKRLKALGFYEFQKSAFVLPYECGNEIDFIIEFYDIRKYVRSGVLDYIDNDAHMRKIFNLRSPA